MNGEELIEIALDVASHQEGWRLDQFVKDRIPRLSRARIQKMIRAQPGGLRPSARVHAGQRIRLVRPAPVEPDTPLHFEVLSQSDGLMAICKPAGLPVHPTARFHRHTLTALLRDRFGAAGAPRLIHRIDRETSGLLLLACTREVEVGMKRALERRAVEKRYLAIVDGDPGPEGRIDLPIGADRETGIRVKQGVVADGLPARTRFRRIGRRGAFSLVEAAPETGRQHQIRVHLAAIGTPIVGDKLYGPDPHCLFEYLETGWTATLERRLILARHALHAAAMRFVHPLTGEAIELTCPLTPDLRRFWQVQQPDEVDARELAGR